MNPIQKLRTICSSKIFDRGVITLLTLVVTAPITIPLAYIFLCQSFEVASSPAGCGTAYFHKVSGFLDSDIELYVRDRKVSLLRKIDVGKVSDSGGQEDPPERAVWSRDGSVIAVKRGGTSGVPEIQWSHAYDFRQHKNYWSNSLKVDPERSKQIAILLEERGGEGMCLFPRNKDTKMYSRPVWPWEW